MLLLLLLVLVAIVATVSFCLAHVVCGVLGKRYAQWSRKRLAFVSAMALPLVFIGLDILALIDLLLNDDPTSLNDAPQRSFFVMQFVLLPSCLAVIPFGCFGGWIAGRRFRNAQKLEAFK